MVSKILKLSMLLALSVSLVSCGSDSDSSSNENAILADMKNFNLDFKPLQTRHEWKVKYSQSLLTNMSSPDLSVLLDTKLNVYDLRQIHCTGYNQASVVEKKMFWVTFMASIAHAESTLNPSLTFRDVDGTLSSGLLQIDINSANRHTYAYTGKRFSQNDLFNPELNLMAGLYIMKHQLEGGMNDDRPEIARRLFTERSYYWSVLTYKRDLITRTFLKNAKANLGFCFIGN